MRTAARTAFFMAILLLISKFIGFIRELLLANYYGTGYIMDAYVMATAIPTIIFGGIFAAISTAYMPIFSNKVELEGEQQANRFTSEVMNLSLGISILAGIFGIIFCNQIVAVFASGFQGETAELTRYFVRITFFYVMFSSTMSLTESYLQYKGVFLPQITVGYIQNLAIIALIVISAYTTYYLLVFGWLLGYAIRVVIVLVFAKKKGFHYTPTIKVNEAAKRIVLLAIPVFLGSSMGQVSSFIDKTLASRLPQGSVAALNYGNILMMMIAGLTISILVTISYPKLAQSSSLNDHERFSDILSTGINLAAIISIPCTIGAILYSRQIVQIVYERGVFDANATSLTSSAFLFYSIGLFFTAVISLLTQAYYSLHNTKTPMIFAGIGVIIDIVFNLILVRYMAHNGLALATSIGNICTAFLLYNGFRKSYPDIDLRKTVRKMILILMLAVSSIGGSWVFYFFTERAELMPKILLFAVTISLAGGFYLILLKIFKVEEVKLIKQIIKQKT